jgi:hypothetical protein
MEFSSFKTTRPLKRIQKGGLGFKKSGGTWMSFRRRNTLPNSVRRSGSGLPHVATPPANRFFKKPADLCTSLFWTSRDVQKHPEKTKGLLEPFL